MRAGKQMVGGVAGRVVRCTGAGSPAAGGQWGQDHEVARRAARRLVTNVVLGAPSDFRMKLYYNDRGHGYL